MLWSFTEDPREPDDTCFASGQRAIASGTRGSGPPPVDLEALGVDIVSIASKFLQRVRGPVLTVGETAQFLRDGGMVRLYVESNKVRFQINQKNTEAAGLKVGSQLLALAAR